MSFPFDFSRNNRRHDTGGLGSPIDLPSGVLGHLTSLANDGPPGDEIGIMDGSITQEDATEFLNMLVISGLEPALRDLEKAAWEVKMDECQLVASIDMANEESMSSIYYVDKYTIFNELAKDGLKLPYVCTECACKRKVLEDECPPRMFCQRDAGICS